MDLSIRDHLRNLSAAAEDIKTKEAERIAKIDFDYIVETCEIAAKKGEKKGVFPTNTINNTLQLRNLLTSAGLDIYYDRDGDGDLVEYHVVW